MWKVSLRIVCTLSLGMALLSGLCSCNKNRENTADELIYVTADSALTKPVGRLLMLYQWGRKYGQTYCAPFFGGTEDIDKDSPEILEIVLDQTVSAAVGSSGTEADRKKFYEVTFAPYDWCSDADHNDLWNKGTEASPSKNDPYDPCPNGWRVPTKRELNVLIDFYQDGKVYWTTDGSIPGEEGKGFKGNVFFHGSSVLFLPASGCRYGDHVVAGDRGGYGCYWSSLVSGVTSNDFYFGARGGFWYDDLHSYSFSVRCIVA
jgi:uncharacterized protein (TIGR02145 family)